MNKGFASRLENALGLYAGKKGQISVRGISQEEMADWLGVKQPTVSNWLRGRVPEWDVLLRIADTLQVDPGWLAFGEKSAAPGPGEGLTEIVQRHVEQAHARGELRDVTAEYAKDGAPAPQASQSRSGRSEAPPVRAPKRRRQGGG